MKTCAVPPWGSAPGDAGAVMVLDLVLIGLAIALNPLPVTGFVLVLSARNGVWKGLAFLLTWLATFVGIIAVVLLMTGGEPPAANSSPSTEALAVKLAVGVGLLCYAERTRRGIGTRHKPSGFMSRVERISPWSAAGLALLLQPWGMVAAGAATVVEADLAHLASYAALMGYCLLASSSLLTMELYATFAPPLGRRAAREAAHLAGGPPGTGPRVAGAVPGPVAGRQEHLRTDRVTRADRGATRVPRAVFRTSRESASASVRCCNGEELRGRGNSATTQG
ncbi:GAP family protein [Streptomyces sp. NPDC005227]|uniref:GAP family protein n=1 Tax=Streptomyces sp. NPDC005227 TaxID=3364707 RepID=UPI0036BD48ED